MLQCPDHPDIVMAMKTGYPSWNQPRDIQCDRCHDYIEDEVYEDELYEYLCVDCLLKLHLKSEVEN